MSVSAKDVLIAQAERLLMVIPNTYKNFSLGRIQEKIFEMYESEKQNPPTGIRAQELTTLMWHWLEAYNAFVMDPNFEESVSNFGIISIRLIEGISVITTFCCDHEHFLSLPSVVYYDKLYLGKAGWNSSANRCYYRSDDAIVISLNKKKIESVKQEIFNCPKCLVKWTINGSKATSGIYTVEVQDVYKGIGMSNSRWMRCSNCNIISWIPYTKK